MNEKKDITTDTIPVKDTPGSMNQSLYKINEAAELTGFSPYALRKGCREGTIPYVWFGSAMLINVPAFMKRLEEESLAVTAPPLPRFGRGSRGGKR